MWWESKQLIRHISFAAVLAGVLVGNSFAAEQGRHSFDSNGVKISYSVQGTGEPVILIHGLYSSGLMNWDLPGTSALLAKNYQVIEPDMPGHGFSDKPETDDAYGLAMVEDIVKLMDELKIKKAHIVGYSMGGIIAGKLMASHPDRVSSVLLGGMGWLKEGSFLQKIWEGMKGKDFLNVPSNCVQSFGKMAVSEEDMKAVKVPVEMVVGDHDPCKALYVDPLEKLRPDWPVVVVKDAGHIVCILKAEFKDEIKKWLDKQAN